VKYLVSFVVGSAISSIGWFVVLSGVNSVFLVVVSFVCT
jgi:hypothetical protein